MSVKFKRKKIEHDRENKEKFIRTHTVFPTKLRFMSKRRKIHAFLNFEVGKFHIKI